MLVKELIDLLSKEDPNKEVYVTYDSFVCQYHLENIIDITGPEKYYSVGIHLCAMRAETLDYEMTYDEKYNVHPAKGRIISQYKEE